MLIKMDGDCILKKGDNPPHERLAQVAHVELVGHRGENLVDTPQAQGMHVDPRENFETIEISSSLRPLTKRSKSYAPLIHIQQACIAWTLPLLIAQRSREKSRSGAFNKKKSNDLKTWMLDTICCSLFLLPLKEEECQYCIQICDDFALTFLKTIPLVAI